jgi:hypothetical protein
MSEIRVDKIQAYQDSFSVTIAGITTFSGTGCVSMPGGTSTQRPEVAKKGQIRYINGDVKKGLEYYNGTDWITVGVANGDIVEGATPIGVFGGGFLEPLSRNTIDYITITSLGNATDFGDLSRTQHGLSACSSSTRGVFGGGYWTNTLDYITINSTGNATDFGDLTGTSRGMVSSCSSSTRGVFGGGASPGSPYILTNTIDFITIATTGNATTFGQLTQARYGLAACSSSTRGVFGGGGQNTIDFITIATTGNATDFGDLTTEKTFIAACSSSTRGVFGGGYDNTPTQVNTIDYITIATTGNALTFGQLTQARTYVSACSSSTRGVFGGGYTAVNTIDFITIASQGTNAQDFGDLTQSRWALAALSNSHGGLLAS